jgi:hypothetical protein
MVPKSLEKLGFQIFAADIEISQCFILFEFLLQDKLSANLD